MVLKLELIKKPIAFLLLLASVPFGVSGMCVSISVYEFVAFCFNCYYTGKLLDYGFWKQMKELLPIICYASVMSILVGVIAYLLPNSLLKLCLGIPVGLLMYTFIARLANDKTYRMLAGIIVRKVPQLGFLLR